VSQRGKLNKKGEGDAASNPKKSKSNRKKSEW
jgi:hypothetical protein